MANIATSNLFLALAGGIFPALFWLWFWLREDRLNPEPKKTILKAFLAGMLAVIPAFFAEHLALVIFENNQTALISSWAFIEEVSKFILIYLLVMRNKEFNEPIDAVIYMITGALGFAAVENFLFVINADTVFISLITTGMRFIGATLLHIVSSAAIGVMIAFSFYKRKVVKIEYAILGVITASLLHAIFNLLIIKNAGVSLFLVFSFVWLLIIVLLLVFEKIKRLTKVNSTFYKKLDI